LAQVVCVGLAVLDHVFMVPEIPNVPTKWHATSYHPVGGGNAATAAVSISRAGGEAVYWGRMGDDDNGGLILRELEDYGVNVENVCRLKGVCSGVSAVLVDSEGERLIVNYSDPELISDAGWLPLETLSETNAVLADLRWNEGAQKTLAAARKQGIPAVLDVDITPEGLSVDVIKESTHALFSEPALAQFASGQSLHEGLLQASEVNQGWVGVTQGASGTSWLEDGKLRHLPAFQIKSVDTLGAGDVFHGLFALGLAEGFPEETSLINASAAAALSCSRTGGRDAIPLKHEIKAFLEERL